MDTNLCDHVMYNEEIYRITDSLVLQLYLNSNLQGKHIPLESSLSRFEKILF